MTLRNQNISNKVKHLPYLLMQLTHEWIFNLEEEENCQFFNDLSRAHTGSEITITHSRVVAWEVEYPERLIIDKIDHL